MITAQYILKVLISNTVLLQALLLFMQRLHTGAGPAVTLANNCVIEVGNWSHVIKEFLISLCSSTFF